MSVVDKTEMRNKVLLTLNSPVTGPEMGIVYATFTQVTASLLLNNFTQEEAKSQILSNNK